VLPVQKKDFVSWRQPPESFWLFAANAHSPFSLPFFLVFMKAMSRIFKQYFALLRRLFFFYDSTLALQRFLLNVKKLARLLYFLIIPNYPSNYLDLAGISGYISGTKFYFEKRE